MPNLDLAKEKESICEPITIELGDEKGTVFTVDKVTDKMFTEVSKIADSKDDDQILQRQMAIFCGCPVKNFDDIDIRLLAKMVNFITDTIAGQMDLDPKKLEALASARMASKKSK